MISLWLASRVTATHSEACVVEIKHICDRPGRTRPWDGRRPAHEVAGGVGLHPRVTTRNLGLRPLERSQTTSKASVTLQTLIATLPRSLLAIRIPREAVGWPYIGSNGPQRLPSGSSGLDRAVTLALTLGTGAVHGDFQSYNHGKSCPTWARRVGFLVPERVVYLP